MTCNIEGKQVRDESIPTAGNTSVVDDKDESDGGANSLNAATRLVEPLRFNNLTPAEIQPQHMRQARKEVNSVRRDLVNVRHEVNQMIASMRQVAQEGQQLAREQQGLVRARRVQQILRRIETLRVHYEASLAEQSRLARRIAAARDLLSAWESAEHQRGKRAASALSHTITSVEQEAHITRECLTEAERFLPHLAVAEEAMRRDGAEVRLDPVTFQRIVGRSRKRIYIAAAIIAVVLITLLYPPWSPPSLAIACTESPKSCSTIHSGSSLHLKNNGTGVLVGWVTISVENDSTHQGQVIPLALLPNASRAFSCDDIGGCSLAPHSSLHIQFTTSGGTPSVTVEP
jgi:hypothetical protein